MFNTDYYQSEELREAGFKSVGENVQVAKNCVIAGVENISFGDNVRIDAFCSLIATGGGYITFGSHIHVGGYCMFSGGGGIIFEDFVGVSQGSKYYSRSDDFSGEHMTGPMVPAKYTSITTGPVHLKKHIIVGSESIILPNVTVGEGCAIGAMTLVNQSTDDWGIYSGVPAKRLKERSKNILNHEKAFLKEYQAGKA